MILKFAAVCIFKKQVLQRGQYCKQEDHKQQILWHDENFNIHTNVWELVNLWRNKSPYLEYIFTVLYNINAMFQMKNN